MGADFSTELGDAGLSEQLRERLNVFQHALERDDPELDDLAIPNHGLTDAGVEQGVESLVRSTHLRSLDLGFNQITATGAQILFDRLGKSRLGAEIKELRLSGNPIGRNGCQALCAYLNATQDMCALEHLYLFQCELDDECALMLANALQLQKTITTINLDMNPFTKKTAIMLQQMLQTNTSLCKLSFVSPVCPSFPDPVMRDIHQALERNSETMARKRHIEEIKQKKMERRLRQAEEEKRRNDEALAEERTRVEEELSKLDDLRKKEDENVRAIEQKMQEEIAKRNAKAAASASARQIALEKAIEGAYAWRNKLTLGGTLQKEWRCGFTVLKTEPGQVGGTPTVSSEQPRRLKACWCDPQDATAPFAGTLHYHCKWEDNHPKDSDEHKSKSRHGTAAADTGYTGCKGSGHICASVGFYTSPRPDLSAAHFFACPHPGAAKIDEETS